MPESLTSFLGVDPVSAPHAISPEHVQSAANVDFSLERGAALVRRGVSQFWAGTSTAPNIHLFRHLSNSNIELSPYYVHNNLGNVYRGALGNYTLILTGGSTSLAGLGCYGNYTLIACGSVTTKDNGTLANEWILQAPTETLDKSVSNAPELEIVLQAPGGSGVFFPVSQTDHPVEQTWDVPSTDLSTIGTSTLDADSTFDSLTLVIDKPAEIVQIWKDYSVGGTSFECFYHAEVKLEDVLYLPVGSTYTWRIPRSQFELRGHTTNTSPWTDIQKCRLVIQGLYHSTGPESEYKVQVANWKIKGGTEFPLNDAQDGYIYRETWATLDEEGSILFEGAAGPETPIFADQGQATLITTETPEGTAHGITHRIFYRYGKLLEDFYAVGTIGIATNSFADTVSDIAAQEEGSLLGPEIYSRDTFPVNVAAVSEPFKGRVFIAHGNTLRWSLPGQINQFPLDSETTVSYSGDEIQALSVWDRLVIINRSSVYEIDGIDYEGPNADWTLQRSGSRRGSKAPNTAIKTPYGVLLLDYEGISMYVPGRGVDTPVEWANEKLSDAFKGNGITDPAAVKGNRLPAINKAYISSASAAFMDDKLYLAVATGASTVAQTVFVLDFRTEKVWHHSYTFGIASLLWDEGNSRLLAGTTDGRLIQLEQGRKDLVNGVTVTPITWSVKTRAWTVPTDTKLENIAVEAQGTGTIKAILDGTSTVTVGSFASPQKVWSFGTLGGRISNNVVFELGGTCSSSLNEGLYGIQWDALSEPQRIAYLVTPPEGGEGENIWDAHFVTIQAFGTGSVLGTFFIDDVAISTQTISSPTTGRVTLPVAYPAETYGYIAHSVWNASTGVSFKLWKDYTSNRPEPPRITTYVSDKQTGDSQFWWKAVGCELNPLGQSVLCTAFIDGVPVGTYTATGDARSEYSFALPSETYGHTGHVQYESEGVFKHYKTRWDTEPEPDSLLFAESPVQATPSEHVAKTWLAELNPQGQSVTGVVFIDGTAVSTSTFTGTVRRVFETGLPNITTGKTIKATYTSTGEFKHYKTEFELEQKPFGKTTWLVTYKKLGGATQLDQARFWALDAEGTSTVTAILEVDGSEISTNTVTLSGRTWFDRLPLPPTARGYLFQQKLEGNQPFKVWASSMDLIRVGVKGLSRLSMKGTPDE